MSASMASVAARENSAAAVAGTGSGSTAGSGSGLAAGAGSAVELALASLPAAISSSDAAALSVITPPTCASMSARVTVSGFICGKSSTSRMAGASQNSMIMRSMP